MLVDAFKLYRGLRKQIRHCLKHPDAPLPASVARRMDPFNMHPRDEQANLEDLLCSVEITIWDIQRDYWAIMDGVDRNPNGKNDHVIRNKIDSFYSHL